VAESSVNVTEGSGKRLHTWDRTISSVLVQDQYVLPGEPALATYLVPFYNISIAVADDHIIQLMAGSSNYLRVNKIYFQQVASTSAANAAISSFRVYRLTTAGSGGTSITPAKFDAGDPAAGATAMTLPSSKGTEGDALWPFALVIRKAISDTTAQAEMTWQWEASARAKGLIVAAGTTNGLAIKTISGRAGATISGYIELTETAWLGA
jgi:hypothetical protein